VAELSQSEVIYIIVLGSLGMLIFVVGFAVFIMIYQKRMLQEQEKRRVMDLEYQQKMIQSQIDSQESERKRIAADLHDSIGSLLWAAKLNVGFLGRSLELDGELRDSYTETMKILDQSIDSVKRISWELTPEAFQHTGLSSSIKELCSRLDGKGLSLMFQEIGQGFFWKDDRALMVFRIVQELINNAVKHAQAKRIKVELNWKPQQLLIEVSDDGIGFKLDDAGMSGLGWWNITHRSKKIDAKVHINEQVQTGSAIELTVPLAP
jgi:two-component system, NarL family, sensor kinase